MEFISILTDFVERAHREVIALIVDLTEEERDRVGEIDQWSTKDSIAHIAFWTKNLAHNLTALERGEPLQNYEHVEETNAENFKKFRDLDWEKVFDMGEQATSDLVKTLQSLDEKTLLATDFFPWQNERPLWMLVVGTGYIHPIFHLASIYLDRDQIDQADRLQEESFSLLKDLDEGEQWQGLLTYNLACHYALTGQKEKAIDGLKTALELRPDLLNWSKEDPDLESLRGDPGYQSVISR